MFRFPHLAPFALALCALVPSAGARNVPSPASGSDRVAAPDNSPEALATAARNILELVEVHNFRMRRIDDMISYFASIPDQDKVRQFSLLREREQNQYQQSLETYRRMLGDADFARVAGLLRNHFEQDQRSGTGDHERRRLAGAQVAAREPERDNAAERAERVRLKMEAQAAEARERAAQQAAQERGQIIARMRASQRAQLAQRLAQARAEQLQARAVAAQRYQSTPESPSNRRADPSQGGMLNGRGANQGRGRSPWQQQPQRR